MGTNEATESLCHDENLFDIQFERYTLNETGHFPSYKYFSSMCVLSVSKSAAIAACAAQTSRAAFAITAEEQ